MRIAYITLQSIFYQSPFLPKQLIRLPRLINITIMRCAHFMYHNLHIQLEIRVPNAISCSIIQDIRVGGRVWLPYKP